MVSLTRDALLGVIARERACEEVGAARAALVDHRTCGTVYTVRQED
jgi:hypothetical protein